MDRTPIPFVVYDSQGRILRTGTCMAMDLDLQAGADGESVLKAKGDDLREYVQQGSVVPRPAFAGFDKTTIQADGVDTAKLADLPEGQVVEVDGERLVVEDGVLELTADVPDVYRVVIKDADAFPYQPFEAEIVAT